MSGRSSKAAVDHRANQLNPNNPQFYSSRETEKDTDQTGGGTSSSGGSGSSSSAGTQADHTNHSNQLNPNNSAYSKSRGK
jgi:hypothetical protein